MVQLFSIFTFSISALLVLYVIFSLNLNNLESFMLSSASSQQYKDERANILHNL